MVNQVNTPETKKVGRPSKQEERERKIKSKLDRIKPMERTRKLSLDKERRVDGMVYRWFNDHNGRVQSALAAGWEHVSNAGELVENPETADEIEKCLAKRVGSNGDGSPLFAYLMAVEEEIYDHTQALKQSSNDRIMEQIESRPSTEDGVNSDDVYLKTADISVSRGKSLKSM